MHYSTRFFSLLAVGLALSIAPHAHADELVKEIRIEGNQRLEPAAVLTYLGIRTGQSVTAYDLDLSVKKLYETGFFSDVGVNTENGVLTVHVVENASINQVIFEGNSKISKDDLEKEITLKSRSVYTRTKVQSDLKRLLDVYRRNGRYSAEITPQIIQLEQNRVNLIYNITEGPKAFIEKISFIGNETYPSTTLEKIISSSRERWYQFLSDSDKYDADRLQYDQELLRKYYLENGYADFKVKSAIAELSPQRDAFYLTFTLEEGEQYTLGNVDVVTKLAKSRTPDLAPSISTQSGDLYNATEVEDSINKMTDVLGDNGFAFVEINPEVKRRPGNEKIIDLTYNITEGPKVYVERINIFGNMRTLDNVIRREFKLSEGDAYSSSKLKRTEQRLNNLGYFEKVNIARTPGTAGDKTQLDVEVTEKSTGEITFGAGFSTSDGPIADFGIKEKNFLGGGQELRARAQVGGNRQQYDIGFTEPYFLGRELEAGFDIYKTVQNYQDNSSFDREALGSVFKLGYSLSEHMKHQLRYTIEESKISNVDVNASTYIKQQEGTSLVSMVGQSFIGDYRDNKFNPTTGYYWRINQDVAGLGGDDKFMRHEVQGEYYIPIAKKWTFVTNGSAGNIFGIGENVRINQRFFLGGQQIRGFANAGLGPRDINTRDALGGNSYYTASGEVRFPLGLPDDLGVSGAAFVDAGSLWDIDATGPGIASANTMRAAGGVGVAWSSPFGPIRIDFALPFMKQDYDDTEVVRFNFGTRF
ncbi:MAG: outer membrane protein assembly factor BamA [Pseudomonadota bacterium]